MSTVLLSSAINTFHGIDDASFIWAP